MPRRRRHTPDEIVVLMRQIELAVKNGRKNSFACREVGIKHTYYRWCKEYGGLTTAGATRLMELERENSKLKRLVTKLSMEKEVLQKFAPDYI